MAKQRVEKIIVSIATTLNLPQKNAPDQDVIIAAVKQWFMNHAGWLLILDNKEKRTKG